LGKDINILSVEYSVREMPTRLLLLLQLLERGQLQTRCTFIPLNKIEGRSIDDRTAAAAQRLAGGADRCRTALSLVGYEADLLPAMRYIFGGSFVCRDLEEARRVTFDKQVHFRPLLPSFT